MKEIRVILLAVLALISSSPAHSQVPANSDIVVTGVGTSKASLKKQQKNYPGGSTPDSYNKIDDGIYECLYLYTISTKDKAGEPVVEDYYCMLDLGRNVARFSDYTVFRADSSILAPTVNPELRDKFISDLENQNYRFYGDVILGFPNGELTYTDLVSPDYLEYTEPLRYMVWDITETTDTVCGYLCTKATASYGGRDWEAWFTEDIPSPYGPWKFNGLPGLIMRVSDTDGIHNFTAISFKSGSTPVAKPANNLISKTTRDKFIDIKARFEKAPHQYIPTEAIRSVEVLKNGEIMINGVELPRRPNGYTPIELR